MAAKIYLFILSLSKGFSQFTLNLSKGFCFSLLLSFISTTAQSQDSVRFTFAECVEYAFANSYERQSMLLDVNQQEETLRGVKLQQTPSVSASLGESLHHAGNEDASYSGNASIGMNIDLMNFSLYRNIESQKLYLERVKHQNAQYDQNLVISILRNYVTIIGNMELIKYQKQIVETSRQQMEQGETKYKAGAILESDYLLLQSQYASNVTSLVESQSSLDNSLIELKVLMSMDATKPLTVIAPTDEFINDFKVTPNLDYALEQSRKNMPQMKLSESSLDIARQDLKIAKTGYIPTIGANASISTSHRDYNNFGKQLDDNFSQSVGISVSIPIYDRSQTQSRVRKARLSIEQAELDRLQTEKEIVNTVVQNYTNIQSAISKYDASTMKYNAWQKTLAVYQTRFKVGSITAVDLLQQENNYLSALYDYIQAKYNFMLQRQLLNIYMGE